MADIPDLRSKEQIFGELIDSIRARLRKDIDLNDGSVLTQTLKLSPKDCSRHLRPRSP